MKGFLVSLFVFCASIAAAHTGVVSGVVKDAETGELLVGATVYVRENGAGTTTDVFGRYTLMVNPGSYTLQISYVGYQTQSHPVEVSEHQILKLNVLLKSGALRLSDLVITAQSPARSLTSITAVDINLRPINSSQDILRMVPGLFIGQHAGGGKAEQIFLRGFDIDHGTDINLSVDGMPVNMVSHAHGQGYSDLHWLIPETIAEVNFDKGPYASDRGDFATAGYAAFNTFSTIDQNLVKLEGGDFGTFRAVSMLKLFDQRKQEGRQQLYAATEFMRTDGYFESPQNFHRLNGMLKYHHRTNDKQLLTVSLSTFSSRWNASGQIPIRAVRAGTITRFGAIDDTEGGDTRRTNAMLKFTSKLNKGVLEQQAFYSYYDFTLYSNFTFFLRSPEYGDQIEQDERRGIFGYHLNYAREDVLHDLRLASSAGAGFRYDRVDDSNLTHTFNRETILEELSRGDIRQLNAFAFVEESLQLSPGLTLQGAVRYDAFRFRYLDVLTNSDNMVTKGIISPKLSVQYDVTPFTTVYIKSGFGFHSNDTRVITERSGRAILPKAFGVDIGTQWKPARNLFVHAALWLLDLEQEFVYVGDEGVVEPSGATLRRGIDIALRYQLTDHLFADADLNYTHARAREGENGNDFIPLAPSFTTMGGLSYKATRWSGSVRYRYLADRPANEDNSLTAEGYFLTDLLMTYTAGRFTFHLSVENVTNQDWMETQFETESRLQGEAEPVSEIHFTPGVPRFVKAGLSFRF